MGRKSFHYMQKSNNIYKTEYKDYRNYVAIMISTDRMMFFDKSGVRARMIEQSKNYKELHIIVFSNKKYEEVRISPNCTVYSTNSLVRWNYISDACKLGKKIIKGLSKDIFLLITCQNPFETALVGKYLASLSIYTELLIQIHTDLYSPYFTKYSLLNRIRLFIAKFTLPQSQVIRVVSNKIADSLVMRGYDKDKIIVKPIDVNIDYIKDAKPAFNLHEKFPQFGKIILMVSRLESEKNIEMAIDALSLAKAKIPNLGLLIVGSGTKLNSLKDRASKLKMESNIAFVGWQTDLIPYYKGCDLFLTTSWYEGYGMTLVEAKAAGCKIVSTDIGVADEVGAAIVDWNPERIAEKIQGILIT